MASASTSFGCFEPSESMLAAIQARISAKAANAPPAAPAATSVDTSLEAAGGGLPVRVAGGFGLREAPANPSASSSSDVPTGPSFRLSGGVMRDTPVTLPAAPPVASYRVETGSGISFSTKEAEHRWAQGETRDDLPAKSAGRHAPSGGLFRVAEEPPPTIDVPEMQKQEIRKGPSLASNPKARAASHGPTRRVPSPLASVASTALKRSSTEQVPFESQEHYGGSSSSSQTPGNIHKSALLVQQLRAQSEAAAHSRGSVGARPSSSSGRPPTGSRPPAQSPSTGTMQHAADQALERVLSQAVGGLNLLASVDGQFSDLPSHRAASVACSQVGSVVGMGKLPSAVTVAGVPVACDGDLVYLGGGLFASVAQPREEREPPKKKSRSRSRQAAFRQLGPRSAVRSASAQIVGQQSGPDMPGDLSPSPSRAQSDGQLGLSGLRDFHGYGQLERHSSAGHDSARGAPQHGSIAGSVASSGPRVWRPSGVSKLPPAKLEPAPSRRLLLEEAGQQPGAHSEVRAQERNDNWRQNQNLFGQQGLLNQLRQFHSDETASKASQLPPSGAPQNAEKRREERRAAKEAKIQQMLEERAIRLADEATKLAEKKRAAALAIQRNASAPELRYGLAGLAAHGAEDLEQQKLRVASKMQILEFFNGYNKAVGRMTAEQTKILLSKLHSSCSVREAIQNSDSFDQESQHHALQERAERLEDEQSIQQRLQQVNDLCNKVFEEEELHM